MANTLGTNPISIDTFGANVTLTDNRADINYVTFSSSNAGHCVLTDTAGNIVFDSRIVAGTSDNQGIHLKTEGLILDVSLGTFAGTSALLVYLK